MDNADNVEGFMAEKAGVWRKTPTSSSSSNNTHSSSSSGGDAGSKDSSSSSSKDAPEPDLLSGLPFRISSSMSAGKDQVLVQVGD
jgi:hypothetical protein